MDIYDTLTVFPDADLMPANFKQYGAVLVPIIRAAKGEGKREIYIKVEIQ
jgi:hypothetical protein